MRIPLLATLVLIIVPFAAGCDSEEPEPASGASSAGTGASTPPPATLPARNFPEDLTVDAERDPMIRERAAEMNAIAVAEMKNLKVGDEVIVLVRGDKGGGTIYGSGPYTLDSAIRKAVVHNGALADRELGLVRVKVIKHEGEHPSVPANGIVPTKWGPYHTSYTIEKVELK